MLPEEELSIDELIAILEKGAESNKTSSIVIVAEGDANGGAYEVAKKVNAKYAQYETRVTVLGHIQRGGSPSAWDRVLASRLGVAAVEGLIAGETNSMAGLVNDQIKYTPLETSISMKFQLNKEELRIAKILSI